MKDASAWCAKKAPAAGEFHLSHERLELYQLELRFLAWVTDLLDEAEQSGARRLREAIDQLDRASLSTLLNTAEGKGKRQRPVRARFFDDARSSATECAVCLDALVAKGAVSEERVVAGKQLPGQIIGILTRLIEIFDTPGELKEEEAAYVASGGASAAASHFEKVKEKEKD